MITKTHAKAIVALTVVWLAASTASACQYELAGDLNKDCRVDWLDIALAAQNWLLDCSRTPHDPACLPTVQWQIEMPMSMSRHSFAGGVIDGKIYIFGGKNADGENLKSTEVFDPVVGKWMMRADNNHNAGYGVEELTGAVVAGKLYVFGAYGWSKWNGVSGTVNFVEEYNPVNNTWRSRAPKPTMVSLAPATVHHGDIYIFGGNYYNEATDTDVDYRVVEAFTRSTNVWRVVTSIPKNVKLFGVATVGDRAYLLGGYLLDEERITGDVMTFDFRTGQWDADSCRPMAKDRMRAFPYGAAAPIIDGKIFLIGGLEGSKDKGIWASNKVDVYDPITDTWYVRDPLPVSLEGHLSLVLDGRIYLMGGKMNTLKTCFSAQY